MMTEDQKLKAIKDFENSVLIANARQICQEKIEGELFFFQTGSVTSGWVRRTFSALCDAIGPDRLDEICEQEAERYGAEVDPELWRSFIAHRDAEFETWCRNQC